LPDGDISLGVGIDDNATSTAITIDASENVGIGTPSPSELVHLEAAGTLKLLLKRTGVAPSEAFIANTGNVLQLTNNVSGIAFNTGTTPTERMRVLATGGLTFNGDTATANALDDYETGTWTPVFGDATIAAGSDATYVKIGKTVWLWAELTMQTAATNSGGGTVTGLPFISASNSVYERGVLTTNSVDYIANAHPWCYSYNGSASIGIYQSRATQGWAPINYANCPTNSSLNLSISYQVP
jgi:hypothetical protein